MPFLARPSEPQPGCDTGGPCLPLACPTPAGSVIAVSHDRYFLRRIATRIVTVDGGKLVDYQGDYEVGAAACKVFRPAVQG